MGDLGRWPRDVFAEAIWCSALSAVDKLVALAYADHAGAGEVAWLSWDRLADRTGLGRSTAARGLRRLVAAGWLEEAERARQHRSARYLLRIPQQCQSGTAQKSQNGTPDEPSSPAASTSSPAASTSSPAATPDLTTDYKKDLTLAREEPTVIVTAEDRQPDRAESFADRLRGQGVDWDDHAVTAAERRITNALGGGASAQGQARGYLMRLADRRSVIRDLRRYLDALTDDQITESVTTRASGSPRTAKAPGCAACRRGWVGEDVEGRPIPCPTCRPEAVSLKRPA